MSSFDPNIPQSIEYHEGEGPVHRSVKSPNKLLSQYEKGIRASFTKDTDRHCFGIREKLPDGKWGGYVWKSYKEVKIIYEKFASGLRKVGIENKGHLGIYAKNRPEWVHSYLASISQGIVVVPLYDTLGPEVISYVINHAELDTVVCSGENFPKGEENPIPPFQSSPDDLFLIMYTSGTTGVPKGVMLTNSNMLSALTALHLYVVHSSASVEICSSDVHLSYLPLAHIFELMCLSCCLQVGGEIGFWRGDIQGLLEDMQALRPTVLVGAPRVFNRIYDRVLTQVHRSGVVSKTLFNYAYNTKRAQLLNTGEESSPLWDKLVFSKMAALIGGRIRLIISGSAPLAPNVQDFLRICFLCKVVQGYGLTETCGITSSSDVNDIRSGHVGAPAVCVELKLIDVPEMNYTSSGKVQQGEICVRGPVIFKGYYKMPEKTAEEVDRDGWFHTGDIGEWLPNGTIKIIDRKKNIFKLAQGEYVAAEYLETVYMRSSFVMQVFVYGDSFQPHLVAIIVPDPDTLLPWAQQQGIKGDIAALCQNETVLSVVYTSLIKVAEKAKLKGFEKVKQIHLEPEPWTIENNMLTPTMKAKRGDLKNRYQDVIAKLYTLPKMDAHSKL